MLHAIERMPARRPLRQACAPAVAALALALAAVVPAHAIDRIELDIGAVSTPALRADGIRAALVLGEHAPESISVGIERVDAGARLGSLRGVWIDCRAPIVREPRFACPAAQVKARGTPLGATAFRASADFASDTRALAFRATGIPLAGGHATVTGRAGSGAWRVESELRALRLGQLRKLAAPWIEIPQGSSAEAELGGRVRAAGGRSAPVANVELATRDLDFTNAAGTLVAENVGAAIAATIRLPRSGLTVEARVSSNSGQALAGPVLLDFGANPLLLAAKGAIARDALVLEELSLALAGLAAAHGTARVAIRPTFAIEQARIAVDELRFPAAYASFMQLALAGSDFGTLRTSGIARGSVEIAGNGVQGLEARLEDVQLEDTRGKFSMHDVHGAVHWVSDATRDVEASHLEWSRGSAYGLSGGSARLDFLARGSGFELTRPARLPIFDGALYVRSLAVRELGKPQAELDFDAVIQPISMPLLSKAFGWPELSGKLSGSIPGLTYRKGLLTVTGDVQAQVFDGTITGSNFRLQDPLGPWPRLFADIIGRGLDLTLVTGTFPIGTITGRLDADIRGLELFNWSPIAFDARLYSTPNDRSPRRISQKAVTSISTIGSGGGGGGVTAALQSGVLQFFDEFNYDRIGLTCRLRNEVCLMSGIERRGVGYYIVKGRGIPRIDIVGSTGRVDWPQLVSQIVAGMRASDDIQVR